jgi:hypothetical protein
VPGPEDGGLPEFSFEGGGGFEGAVFAALSIGGGAVMAARLPTSNLTSTDGVLPEFKSISCVVGANPSSEISA